MLESTSSPSSADEVRTRLKIQSPNIGPLMLAAPAAFIIGVFFAMPALVMLRMSFNRHADGRIYIPDWTLANYVRLISDPFYVSSIAYTSVLAATVAVVTVVLAYPYSLCIWRSGSTRRVLLMGLALLPLLISEVSTIVGWQLFFPRSGFLSALLSGLGIAQGRFSLMFTFTAAVLGVTYITLPFAIWILVSTLDRLDRRLIEASADLGAPPAMTFREVLLPLTKGGILVAFAQAFIWAMGTYATPSALGPDWLWTIGLETYRQMNSWQNWPFASALTFLLASSITAIMLLLRVAGPRQGKYHA